MRDDQLSLAIAAEQGFVDWYVDTFMPEHLSVFCEELSRGIRKQRVIYGRKQAIVLGFNEPINQAHFVTLMWDIGPGFYHFPGYKDIAEATDDLESNRIDRFYDDISDEQDKAATL
ncbi:MAG: hypothetical protein ACKE51_04275, partial [Methylococcaceae bacterium]